MHNKVHCFSFNAHTHAQLFDIHHKIGEILLLLHRVLVNIRATYRTRAYSLEVCDALFTLCHYLLPTLYTIEYIIYEIVSVIA